MEIKGHKYSTFVSDMCKHEQKSCTVHTWYGKQEGSVANLSDRKTKVKKGVTIPYINYQQYSN